MNTLEALTTIREQSELTDDEWQWLCETVTARHQGEYLHSDVIPPVPTTTDLSGVSAWVTVHQLADVLGIKAGLARQWKLRGKLPTPDETINGRAVWSRRTVKQFCEGLQLLNRAGATPQAMRGT